MNEAVAGDVEQFRRLLSLRLGLSLEEVRLDTLASLLERRASALRSPVAAYIASLEDRANQTELRAVAIELTVSETYFFRHAEQLRAFADVALPERLAARGDAKQLRILSVGCASGEEPYTLAILLRDRGIDPGRGSIRAVDVSPAALAKAARATYSPWALRETPTAVQSRWFEPTERDYRLDPSIREMVTFEERNLAEDDGASLFAAASYDIIFFRNVVMYFTPAHAAECVRRITRALVPRGFLFLGHAETLRGLSSDYHLRHAHGAFYYQLRDPGEHMGAEREPAPLPSARANAPRPEPSTSWVETIRDASDRVRDLAARSTSDEMPARSVHPTRLSTAMKLAQAERFADALDALGLPGEAPDDVDVLLLRAALLTQNGEIGAAETACRELLAFDDLHAGAHYLLALCCEASADARGATEHDRMAAYLDPSFAMPRLHLGLAARRTGDSETARVELGRALELLHREDAARILLFGGGFARDALVGLCRAELRACGGNP